MENRCEESSWRAGTKNKYGPGGYNRCTKEGGHPGFHEDGFGNRFYLEPKFRVLKRERRRS